MFQNDIQSISGHHIIFPSTTLPSRLKGRREENAGAIAMQKKPLPLPRMQALATGSNFIPPAILYRNSAECRPYHHVLHAFEGSQFGNDFTCESADFEHWFNAEAYFCAAAFSNSDSKQAQILSFIEMLFVTEASAQELLRGAISEQSLVPYDKSNAGTTPPVIYFSSMISQNAQDSVRLLRSVIKDIHTYIEKYRVTPNWGFSIVISEKAKDYLISSGFYKVTSQSFLNKYDMVKIDCHSARSKIWSSILKEPSSASITTAKANTRPILITKSPAICQANT